MLVSWGETYLKIVHIKSTNVLDWIWKTWIQWNELLVSFFDFFLLHSIFLCIFYCSKMVSPPLRNPREAKAGVFFFVYVVHLSEWLDAPIHFGEFWYSRTLRTMPCAVSCWFWSVAWPLIFLIFFPDAFWDSVCMWLLTVFEGCFFLCDGGVMAFQCFPPTPMRFLNSCVIDFFPVRFWCLRSRGCLFVVNRTLCSYFFLPTLYCNRGCACWFLTKLSVCCCRFFPPPKLSGWGVWDFFSGLWPDESPQRFFVRPLQNYVCWSIIEFKFSKQNDQRPWQGQHHAPSGF